MSDDLTKRLRMRDNNKHGYFGNPLFNRDGPEAADRIAQLERERDQLFAESAKNSAKLAKAVEALRKIADFSEGNVVKYIQGVDTIALDVLAELEAKA